MKTINPVKQTSGEDSDRRLLQYAKKLFSNSRKQLFVLWFTLYKIRERQLFKLDGYRSFEAYCTDEFDWDYSTISKRLTVLEEFGQQIKSLKLNDVSWETAYLLYCEKGTLPTHRYKELTTKVLKGDLTRPGLEKEVETVRAIAIAEVDADCEADFAKYEDCKLDDENLDVSEPSEIENSIAGIETRVSYLLDNLPCIEMASLKSLSEVRRDKFKTSLEELKTTLNVAVDSIHDERGR